MPDARLKRTLLQRAKAAGVASTVVALFVATITKCGWRKTFGWMMIAFLAGATAWIFVEKNLETQAAKDAENDKRIPSLNWVGGSVEDALFVMAPIVLILLFGFMQFMGILPPL